MLHLFCLKKIKIGGKAKNNYSVFHIYGVYPALIEVFIACTGENVECHVIENSRPRRDFMTVSFGFNVKYTDVSSIGTGVNIGIDPDLDFEHAFV